MTTKLYKIEEQIESIGAKNNKILRDFIHNNTEVFYKNRTTGFY